MKPLIECIPNFSEGKDPATLQALADAIRSVPEVALLHMDAGEAAHRTVYTFAGPPAAVLEAAYRAIRVAAERIDMRLHDGIHPRIGATDVCPFVPLRDITREDLLPLVDELARRVGEELGIPIYLYEDAARAAHRRRIEQIRAGGYEAFRDKILLPEWQPDYGPRTFQPGPGQTVMGVRDFLVAYNINLDSEDVALAQRIAEDLRESGRIITEKGGRTRIPGRFRHLKAIGWQVAEYGCAQISCNLTQIAETPVHAVYEAALELAAQYGARLAGSELIGLIPERCLLEAGRYYLHDPAADAAQAVAIAVQRLGLDVLRPFVPQERVIEYVLRERGLW